MPILPSAHEKPFFVVGIFSLGLCQVLEINDRNYGSQNKNDLREDTFRVARIHRGRWVWMSVLASEKKGASGLGVVVFLFFFDEVNDRSPMKTRCADVPVSTVLKLRTFWLAPPTAASASCKRDGRQSPN